MTVPTAGKIRGLTAASNRAGVFTILAVDHRDSLRAVLDGEHPADVPDAEMTGAKLELIRGLADLASAVLVDPEYSALQAISRRALPGDTAFLCALEEQGYLGDPDARLTELLDGWSVEQAKRLGAAGVKLLLLYRPDGGAAGKQEELVSQVVADCRRHDIPLFLEPVSYRPGGEETPGTAQFDDDRRSVVCESARRLGALGPDVLKVQFPADTSGAADRGAWADACAELDEACPVPWALLSGGDPFESFVEQVRIACEAGASGFLVGRALWRDVVRARPEERTGVLQSVVRPRLSELSAIATQLGTDWADRYDLPSPDSQSFRKY